MEKKMSPDTDKLPDYSKILSEILSSVDGSISTEELVVQILQQHPSTAKNPHVAVLQKIRAEDGRQLVYLDADHVLPLRLAYQGARYRIRLNKEIINKSALPIESGFQHYLPTWFKRDGIRLIDSQGKLILSKSLKVQHKDKKKKIEYEESVIVPREWFREKNLNSQDHILVTVENWEQGIFRLECERFKDQRMDLLAERNHLMADMLYKMLESAQRESILIQNAGAIVYAKMPDKGGYPADHIFFIAVNDPRMATDDGVFITLTAGFLHGKR
jgi:hypothetical protein